MNERTWRNTKAWMKKRPLTPAFCDLPRPGLAAVYLLACNDHVEAGSLQQMSRVDGRSWVFYWSFHTLSLICPGDLDNCWEAIYNPLHRQTILVYQLTARHEKDGWGFHFPKESGTSHVFPHFLVAVLHMLRYSLLYPRSSPIFIDIDRVNGRLYQFLGTSDCPTSFTCRRFTIVTLRLDMRIAYNSAALVGWIVWGIVWGGLMHFYAGYHILCIFKE